MKTLYYVKSKKLVNDNGSYYITPLLEVMPPNVGIFVCLEEDQIYLQTSYVSQDQAMAIKLLLGDLFDCIVTGYSTPPDIQPDITPGEPKITKPDITPKKPLQYNYGRVTSPTGLNIRAAADLNAAKVGVLEGGQRFKVDTSFVNDEWVKITMPCDGYIYKEFTSFSDTPVTVSNNLINFTASWEGFSSTPYKDAGGNWTVGFGDCTYGVEPAPVTYQQALTTLENTLNTLAGQVHNLTNDLNLNQSEFDSLVDFSYNLGLGSLKYSEETPGLLSAIIKCENNQTVLNDFVAWDHCDGRELLGLKRRRIAEAQMFVSGQYNNN